MSVRRRKVRLHGKRSRARRIGTTPAKNIPTKKAIKS